MRWRTRRRNASASSGATRRTCVRPGSRTAMLGRPPVPSSVRRATITPMAPSRRRVQNSTTRPVGTSSAWTSSMARSTVRCAASRSSTVSAAVATARGSASARGCQSGESAASSALRWKPGNPSFASSPTRAKSCASAAYGVAVAWKRPVHVSTSALRRRAAATAASSSVVRPMPGPPSNTSAAGPSSSASRKRSMDSRSPSRPMTWLGTSTMTPGALRAVIGGAR